jgi:tRNA dimethylallyltransferase
MAKKLIVILGPTASGKSEIAVKLAKKLNGQVVSADSRQIYKGMDIGAGKITKKETQGIPHYLLDVALPKRRFTVVQYRKLARKAINKILRKKKVPILCGGTGFYIQAVIDGIIIPEVKPDYILRSSLDKLEIKDLFKKIKKLDPKRARTIDKKNKRRLIRALEIVIKTNKPVPSLKKEPLPYPVLMIGVKKEKKSLEKIIEKRFFKWLRLGLIKEVGKLNQSGLSWKRIEEFGIHYRVIALYLQNKITYKEMIENSLKELKNYAKRQMTWFKRDKRINWIKKQQEAEKLVKGFLEMN